MVPRLQVTIHGWSESARYLHGTCVDKGLPYWLLFGGLLRWRSCSAGLGPCSPPWHPHCCQWCGCWPGLVDSHWAPLAWPYFSATFFSAFRCLFNLFLLSSAHHHPHSPQAPVTTAIPLEGLRSPSNVTISFMVYLVNNENITRS